VLSEFTGAESSFQNLSFIQLARAVFMQIANINLYQIEDGPLRPRSELALAPTTISFFCG
jgi:hypothetical protein